MVAKLPAVCPANIIRLMVVPVCVKVDTRGKGRAIKIYHIPQGQSSAKLCVIESLGNQFIGSSGHHVIIISLTL